MELICKCCGRKLSLSNIKYTEDGDVICYECADTKYYKCDRCDNYIKKEPDEGYRVCKECDSLIYNKPLNNYSLKPVPRFKSKKYPHKNAGRYFGLELEYNHLSPTGAFMIFRDLYKEQFIYNKSDGSVCDGVEIVTNPLDKSTAFKLLDRMKPGLETINEECNRTSDNAGIHIHVNRSSIDPIDIYKLGYLLNYRASTVEKRFIYYLSGRLSKSTMTESSFHYANVGNVTDKFTASKSGGDRYKALNLNNKNTIEFRIFKSTLDIDKIKAYIELVNDFIDYAHNFGFKEMNISSFAKWELSYSNNKYIINRIKNFQKYNGKFESKVNEYKFNISNLKGINISKWERLISDLKLASNIEDMNEVVYYHKTHDTGRCNNISRRGISSPPSRKLKTADLVNKLELTLKKVLINKIMKGIEQCA